MMNGNTVTVRDEARKIATVLIQPAYALLAAATAGAAFALYAVLLNYELLLSTALAGNVSLLTGLVPTLVAGYVHTTTGVSILFSILISLTIGVNVALVTYRLVELSSFGREGASSFGGIILAVLAPACPACATAIFAVAGTTSMFAILPFNGTEFKALALLLLLGSAYWISTQIDKKHCDLC